MYLWSWYQQLSDSNQRIFDGTCRPIPPSEFVAWQSLTGNIVNHIEYDILVAMDRAFCDETNKELQDFHVREREAHQRELEAQRKVKK